MKPNEKIINGTKIFIQACNKEKDGELWANVVINGAFRKCVFGALSVAIDNSIVPAPEDFRRFVEFNQAEIKGFVLQLCGTNQCELF